MVEILASASPLTVSPASIEFMYAIALAVLKKIIISVYGEISSPAIVMRWECEDKIGKSNCFQLVTEICVSLFVLHLKKKLGNSI